MAMFRQVLSCQSHNPHDNCTHNRIVGDIVEVSRVLLLEEEWVDPRDPLHEVVWYQHPSTRSDLPVDAPAGSPQGVHREYVLIALGHGALYKSPPAGG